jgi:hypothetical protein
MKSILMLVLLTLASSLAFGQKLTQQQAAAAATPSPTASTTCAYTFTSGAGATYTQYCVTVNGNIASFQNPSGVEDINVGQIGEGYGICDFTTNTGYFDYAYTDSGNWLSPVLLSSTTAQVKIGRTTSDGIWQLTQTITKVAATTKTPGSATVTMALKNLTGISRTVYFLRFADVDANSSVSPNDFDYTFNVATGLQPGFSYGLMLSNNTFTFGHEAFIQSTFNGPDPCNFSANLVNPGPFVGDGSFAQIYAIAVPKLATKTVTMTYKPI